MHVWLALVVLGIYSGIYRFNRDFKKPNLSVNRYTNEKSVECTKVLRELYPRMTFRAMNSFPPSVVIHGRFAQSSQRCSTRV